MIKLIIPTQVECLVQTYPDGKGWWWRYCVTCDDGSNKYRKHPRGHRSEADAKMSARDHAKQMLANRIGRARFLAWRDLVIDADTWDGFVEVMRVRPSFRADYGRLVEGLDPGRRGDFMASVRTMYAEAKAEGR